MRNTTPHPPSSFILHPLSGALATLSLAFALASPAWAERADRLQKIVVDAAQSQVDVQKQVVVYSGNVGIRQGSMVIRADRVELRELPSGYYTAVAYGSPNKPATFRQKRDGIDEYIEGEADRLEYDGKSDTIKFINRAQLRRLRGATLADEINGNLITYDAITEKVNIQGGGPATAANPNSRVQAVLTPRQDSEADREIRAAAEAAASAPLKTSPSITPPASAAKGQP